MLRAIAIGILALLAGCAQPRPDTHDNFDAWQRSLKNVPEPALIAAMGRIPEASYQLDERTKILQWRWNTAYLNPGIPPDYKLLNGVWTPSGGVAPSLVTEGCIAEWYVQDRRAIRYRWEGWACRAMPPAAAQIRPSDKGD